MVGKRKRNWPLQHAMSNIECQKRIWTKQLPIIKYYCHRSGVFKSKGKIEVH